MPTNAPNLLFVFFKIQLGPSYFEILPPGVSQLPIFQPWRIPPTDHGNALRDVHHRGHVWDPPEAVVGEAPLQDRSSEVTARARRKLLCASGMPEMVGWMGITRFKIYVIHHHRHHHHHHHGGAYHSYRRQHQHEFNHWYSRFFPVPQSDSIISWSFGTPEWLWVYFSLHTYMHRLLDIYWR